MRWRNLYLMRCLLWLMERNIRLDFRHVNTNYGICNQTSSSHFCQSFFQLGYNGDLVDSIMQNETLAEVAGRVSLNFNMLKLDKPCHISKGGL